MPSSSTVQPASATGPDAVTSSARETPPGSAVQGQIYRDGVSVSRTTSVEQVLDALADERATAWLDLVAPRPTDLWALAERLGLHPLAVEDALAEPQRPKLDRYSKHLFIAAYLPGYDPATRTLDPAELSVFVTDRILVTVRQRADALAPDELERRWGENPDLAAHGVGYLLHGLLDYVIDEQYTVTRQIENAVEDLEDSLFEDPAGVGADVQRRGFELRKSLTRARRIAQPTIDLLLELDRPGVGVVNEALRPYFADVRDHAVRAAERLDSLREMVGAVLDTRLAIRGDQLNEIMKKLTSWAAIIAVPTAVTGFYGQNVPYPGFQEWSGFLASISLTVVIALLLFGVLKRRGWL